MISVSNASWYQPAVGVTWQWQLKEAINPDYNVEIYNVDLFDTSEDVIASLQSSGKKVICYFSAGSYENWRTDIDSFNSSDLGNVLDGWPDEQWLDIRSEDVLAVMQIRHDLAVSKGCDGVEPDNVEAISMIPVSRWLQRINSHLIVHWRSKPIAAIFPLD